MISEYIFILIFIYFDDEIKSNKLNLTKTTNENILIMRKFDQIYTHFL